MIICTRCRTCSSEIKMRTFAGNRVELAKAKGQIIPVQCKVCNKRADYRVDDFRAKPGQIVRITATLILLIGTPVLTFGIWNYLYSVNQPYQILTLVPLILIPITVYGIMTKEENNKIKNFNRHKIKGF